MRRHTALIVAEALLIAVCVGWMAYLEKPSPVEAQSINFHYDPCPSADIPKSSASIAVSSATTSQLVASSTTQRIYFCGFIVSYASGTAPTVQFEYGTGGSCTSPTVLTGAMSIPATAGQVIGARLALSPVPIGSTLCIVSGGTGPTFNGYATYAME